MPNYKKMYFALFNAVTNAIHELQEAQQKGEESYIGSMEDFLVSPQSPGGKNEQAAE